MDSTSIVINLIGRINLNHVRRISRTNVGHSPRICLRSEFFKSDCKRGTVKLWFGYTAYFPANHLTSHNTANLLVRVTQSTQVKDVIIGLDIVNESWIIRAPRTHMACLPRRHRPHSHGPHPDFGPQWDCPQDSLDRRWSKGFFILKSSTTYSIYSFPVIEHI